MSAADAIVQIDMLMDEIADVNYNLQQIEGKLDSIQGGSILLGLSDSNNNDVIGLVQLIQAAKQNKDTLGRFMFGIQQRLTEHRKNL